MLVLDHGHRVAKYNCEDMTGKRSPENYHSQAIPGCTKDLTPTVRKVVIRYQLNHLYNLKRTIPKREILKERYRIYLSTLQGINNLVISDGSRIRRT